MRNPPARAKRELGAIGGGFISYITRIPQPTQPCQTSACEYSTSCLPRFCGALLCVFGSCHVVCRRTLGPRLRRFLMFYFRKPKRPSSPRQHVQLGPGHTRAPSTWALT